MKITDKIKFPNFIVRTMQLEEISRTGETMSLLLGSPLLDVWAPSLCQTHEAPTICQRLQIRNALLLDSFLYRACWAVTCSGKWHGGHSSGPCPDASFGSDSWGRKKNRKVLEMHCKCMKCGHSFGETQGTKPKEWWCLKLPQAVSSWIDFSNCV